MNLEGLDPRILGPAIAAGLLVLATHVPLGRHVLARGIIFIDLAVAQIAGVGVLLAHAAGWEAHPWAVQLIAFGTALAGALVLYLCERRWSQIQEALIGTAFVLAATAGILLLSNNPHGGEHLKDLLIGQILWVDYTQLGPVALLYACVLTLWFGMAQRGRQLRFYLLFAVTVTASVQLVGIYLVFASLIVPALAVRHAGQSGLFIAYVLGLVAYGLGLAAAAILDLPAGAVIVWTLTLAALAVGFGRTSSRPRGAPAASAPSAGPGE